MKCNCCGEIFELKSKEGRIGNRINDGAYATMIARITSITNPALFIMRYSKDYNVTDLTLIPKFFFVPHIIEKRKPLAPTTRRAGWTGCNISWLFDVLNCVNRIETDEFCLQDVYTYGEVLQEKHRNNHNVEAKIRQQLQFLRDKGFIVFLGRGHYRKRF